MFFSKGAPHHYQWEEAVKSIPSNLLECIGLQFKVECNKFLWNTILLIYT